MSNHEYDDDAYIYDLQHQPLNEGAEDIPSLVPCISQDQMLKISNIKHALIQSSAATTSATKKETQSFYDFTCPNQRSRKRKMELTKGSDDDSSDEYSDEDSEHEHEQEQKQQQHQQQQARNKPRKIYTLSDDDDDDVQIYTPAFAPSPRSVSTPKQKPKPPHQLSAKATLQLHKLNVEYEKVHRLQQELLKAPQYEISDSDDEQSHLEDDEEEDEDEEVEEVSLEEEPSDSEGLEQGSRTLSIYLVSDNRTRQLFRASTNSTVESIVVQFEQKHNCKVTKIMFDGDHIQRNVTIGNIEDLEDQDQLDVVIIKH